MDQTLGFLREVISNYTEDQKISRSVYRKITEIPFISEEEFVRTLEEEEIQFLNKILPNEINYAMENQDFQRVKELNGVYELLF